MANEVTWKAPTVRTTGIASASLSAGANVLGSAIDNDTHEARFLAAELAFTCAVAPSANKTYRLFALYSLNGTDYEDGDATPTDPAKLPLATFKIRAVTVAQKQTKVRLPIDPFKFKLLLQSENDQDATGVSVIAYTYNEDIQ